MHTIVRRTILSVALAIAATGVPAGMSRPAGAAHGIAFDCPVPVAASPSPAAGEASPAAPATVVAAFPEGGGELTVFAAASLTDAFGAIGTELEAAYDGLSITYNFGGSQALVTQLAEGAEADVFASANNAQMTAAEKNGSISGEPVTFVHNELAIVTPADNPAGIESAADLGSEGLRLVLAQAEVPVGRYSRESICMMGVDRADFGDDFASRVAANVVSEEEDVRGVLAKVQLGEADAGIVYVSDVNIAGDDVTLIEIPAVFNVVAAYPIANVAGGDEALGDAFIAYVLSPEGQATLEEFGFSPVS